MDSFTSQEVWHTQDTGVKFIATGNTCIYGCIYIYTYAYMDDIIMITFIIIIMIIIIATIAIIMVVILLTINDN